MYVKNKQTNKKSARININNRCITVNYGITTTGNLKKCITLSELKYFQI